MTKRWMVVICAVGLAGGGCSSRISGEAPLDQLEGGVGLFSGAGVFVIDSGFSPGHAGVLRENGFAWVAPQIHNGMNVNGAALDAGWIQAWREAGFAVGGWGVEHGYRGETSEAEEEAALAAGLVRDHGLDFYIANAEKDYERTQDCEGPFGTCSNACTNGTCWSDEAVARSRRFVNAFRAQTDVAAALSSYGSSADVDWAAWRDAGFHMMPQAYWNNYEHFEPVYGAHWYESAGWPAGMIHPTIGLFNSETGRIDPDTGSTYWPAAKYAERLRQLRDEGVVGFSVYLGETVRDDGEYAALRDLAGGGGVAVAMSAAEGPRSASTATPIASARTGTGTAPPSGAGR